MVEIGNNKYQLEKGCRNWKKGSINRRKVVEIGNEWQKQQKGNLKGRKGEKLGNIIERGKRQQKLVKFIRNRKQEVETGKR